MLNLVKIWVVILETKRGVADCNFEVCDNVYNNQTTVSKRMKLKRHVKDITILMDIF